MLNAIRVSKIDQAINELLAYLPDREPIHMEDIGEFFFDWQGLHIRYIWRFETFALVFDSEEPEHTSKSNAKEQVRLTLNKMWGGTTNDIIKFSVFNHGYTTETRTDVFNDGVEVHEIRVGHLIADTGYRA